MLPFSLLPSLVPYSFSLSLSFLLFFFGLPLLHRKESRRAVRLLRWYQTKITLSHGTGEGRSSERPSKPPAGKFRAVEREEWEFPSRQQREVGFRDRRHNLPLHFLPLLRQADAKSLRRVASPLSGFIRRGCIRLGCNFSDIMMSRTPSPIIEPEITASIDIHDCVPCASICSWYK